ncbi:MAG: fibronectin type III domain-containing protein [Verrucomicrobiota bacterium]
MKLVNTSKYAKLSHRTLMTEINKIKQGIAGIPKFASLAAKLTIIGNKLTSSVAKLDARDAAELTLKELIAINTTDAEEVIVLAKDVIVDCESLTDDPTDLMAVGLELVKDRQPAGTPEQVMNLCAVTVSDQGKLAVKWKKAKFATLYEISTTDDPNIGTWTLRSAASKCKETLEGLPSGKRIWVRVRAKGSAGYGLWSDPAGAVVS